MLSIDDLIREKEQLRAENDMLKMLLKENGIALPTTVSKREVRIYDYINNHAVMLEKMYRKRLKGYAGIGYSVAADQQDASLSSDIIYNQITFQERFLQDIAEAKESVVIVSPYVTVKRVRWIEATLQQCNQKHMKVNRN